MPSMSAPGKMDALYIFKHSANDDFEIRHSLKSIEQYATYIRKVWIYGDKPKFMSEDTSLIEHVPHETASRVLGVKTPVTSLFLQIFLSSLIPELSFEYLFFSDNFYFLKPTPSKKRAKTVTSKTCLWQWFADAGFGRMRFGALTIC
jgi:hypothetical protein